MEKVFFSILLLAACSAYAVSNVEEFETKKFCDNVATLGTDAYQRRRAHQGSPDLEKWKDRPIILWALNYGFNKANSGQDAYSMSRAYCADHTKQAQN